MNRSTPDIQIISAPSILGLRPSGVEHLAESLLDNGLTEALNSSYPVIHVPVLNNKYNYKRDPQTNCLNPIAIKEFSLTLGKTISNTINKDRFAFVLGGDCSILTGIMPALKKKGVHGIIFIDAHADFYEPEKSTTGEVADMDLAIITGRGPEMLTNIDNQRPYVKDEHVVHIGQRDWKETKKYGSRDIRKTTIKCISLTEIKKNGIDTALADVVKHMDRMDVKGFWIHFDTDVLSDKINPAVDYRLPDGMSFKQIEYLLRGLLLTGKIAGISVTIFNPTLDKDKHIAKHIVKSLGKAFTNE